MSYAISNTSTAEVLFLSSEDVAQTGQVAIAINDNHPIILGGRPLSHWRLNSIGDDVEINLDAVKLEKIAKLSKEAKEYVEKHYPIQTQIVLIMLMTEGIIQSYPNRIGYLAPAMGWGLTIILYNKSIEDQINSLATVQAVDDFTWDFDQFTVSDPLVNIAQAAQITD